MDKLFIQLLICDYYESGLVIAKIDKAMPYWFLHGGVIIQTLKDNKPVSDDIDNCDSAIIAIYGEDDFMSNIDLTDVNHSFVKRILTPDELNTIETSAAIDLLRTTINKDNISIIGDALLNKHPECRKASSSNLAIINAALKERAETFTDDDYLDFYK